MERIETLHVQQWNTQFTSEQQMEALRALETGKVIFLPQLAFNLDAHEQRFLSPEFVAPKSKNISYDLRNQRLRGAQGSLHDCQQLQTMVARFAQQANQLITNLFPHYQDALQIARTSFRPVEISNRKTSYRKDDKRLHVDAFPANPNQGKRILRVFSNINPQHDRVWRLGESFETVAKRFLPQIKMPLPGSAKILQMLKLTKSQRTKYDHIMLCMHDYMKANEDYQRDAAQMEMRFPPNSTWIVQTDQVSHAAMAGQHMLEQTFYLPVHAMQEPHHSPLKVLERLVGSSLV